MKFKELIDNPSKENQIRFKKSCIERIKKDIEENGDNGFGSKKRQIENLEKDIERLQNDNKRNIK